MSTPHGFKGAGTGAELPDRVQRLLSALVREYIEHGEPVSSQWLAEHAGCAVSSATVRNLLGRLEDHGFVRQPHTSAGRVPTDLAYRYFVDLLLCAYRPAKLANDVEARLRSTPAVPDVLERVSHELSRMSHHVGFAIAPPEEGRLERLEFVPLEGGRILVVLVAQGGEVSHKVITFAEPLSREQLIQAGNYLTEEFAGLTIEEARGAVLVRMQAERVLYDELRARALSLARQTLESLSTEDQVFVSGTPTLMDGEVLENVEGLRSLLAMIEEKHRLLRLLTTYIETPGLTVVIGREHIAPDLQSLSLVAATYTDGQRTGVVGVLGPRRMKYGRAIAAVDGLSRAITRLLAAEPAQG